jgi:hypothetical protein
MPRWGNRGYICALSLALAATTCLTSADAADGRTLAHATRTSLATTPPGYSGDALTVGGLLVHLDNFIEQRDGTVRADMSFTNPTTAPAALTAPTTSQGDHIGTLLQSLDTPVAALTNGEGRKYRLVALSQFGDTVPAGGTTILTATFAPDGARRGLQPFALSLPIRETWRASADAAERSSAFQVNFRGLHRPTDEAHAAPAPHVEKAAFPAAVSPARPAETAVAGNFTDDLSPAIAKLPTAAPDNQRYLLAIGVNTYDEVPGVPFADRSARAMSDLLHKAYGVPEDNITLVTGNEATGTKMVGRINSLLKRLTPGDTVFFYYAGHGLAARDGNSVYMVPKDAVPGAYEIDALSLGALLARFEASPASHVVAFLDTCFSGRISHDQSLFPGIAPLVPVPVQMPGPTLHSTNKVTVFLASQADQFANDYPERGHRLFSYYIMRGLMAGYTRADDLESYVAQEVRRVSTKRGSDFAQEPRLEGAAQILPKALVRVHMNAAR